MNKNSKWKKLPGNHMEFTITPPKLKSNKKGNNLLLFILKTSACVLVPLIVPIIVYSAEGFTTLFWCILSIAFFTSFLLLTLDVQKVKTLTEYLKANQRDAIRCLIKAISMFLVCGVGTYAYQQHLYEIFNVSIFLVGVITGTFLSDFVTWWNVRRKKNLPYVNFTKNSPIPKKPSFHDLRRKSLNVSDCATNFLPLKRQLSSPANKSLISPQLNVAVLPVPVLEDSNVSMSPSVFLGYPSSSSSSGDSDGLDVPQESTNLTPTKRKVISAGLISLSPLANTPKTEPISKTRLEFHRALSPTPMRPSDNSHLHTASALTYTECSVENLMSQNCSFFHM